MVAVISPLELLALHDGPWMSLGSCVDTDPDIWFPPGESKLYEDDIAQAKAICRTCPVRKACLNYALETGQDYGIWGGATESERRIMRRERTKADAC